MLDDIKAEESYEKFKLRAMYRECCKNWMPRTNEDESIYKIQVLNI